MVGDEHSVITFRLSLVKVMVRCLRRYFVFQLNNKLFHQILRSGDRFKFIALSVCKKKKKKEQPSLKTILHQVCPMGLFEGGLLYKENAFHSFHLFQNKLSTSFVCFVGPPEHHLENGSKGQC